MTDRPSFRALAGAAFLAALWLPLLASVTGISARNLLKTERNRTAATDVVAEAEHWLRAHTGFRRGAIAGRRDLLLFGLGESPIDELTFGRDDWLFYVPRRPAAAIARREAFGIEHVGFWKRTLEARARWLRGQGIAYV
ncbi:MAG: hypothetical protein ACREQJ_15800, partial [Candidatus Binatia bacterium]